MKTTGYTSGKRRWNPVDRLLVSRCGATAVEFALIAPIFLIMVIGIFEMGRAMWIKSSMQFAVEEASRYAIVNPTATTSTLETQATTALTDMGVGFSGDVTFTATEIVSGSRTFKQILGSYSFTVLVPLVPFPDVTLSAKSRVPVS